MRKNRFCRTDDLLAMRAAIFAALEKRFLKEKMSRRKEKDGSLTYQEFLDKVEKGNEEVPITYINKKDKK